MVVVSSNSKKVSIEPPYPSDVCKLMYVCTPPGIYTSQNRKIQFTQRERERERMSDDKSLSQHMKCVSALREILAGTYSLTQSVTND